MIYFRDAQQAFADAVRNGHLSATSVIANYAGGMMYMGTEAKVGGWFDGFKHRNTRRYLWVPAPAPTAADLVYNAPGQLATDEQIAAA